MNLDPLFGKNMNYSEFLQAVMNNNHNTSVVTTRCVLYIRFPPDILFSSKDAMSLFAYIYSKQAEYIVFLEKHTSEILRHPTGIIAFFSDSTLALTTAIELMSQYLCISLDMGEGWLIDDEIWVGPARWRSERMSFFIPPHQLWVSHSFVKHSPLPNGIGYFEGNRHQAQKLGFDYCEIKDYRDF